MSIVKVNFFSEALLRYVNFIAVLPIDKRSVDGEKRRGKEEPMKSLYLLHGIYGCETDWITRSRIARWAQENNLAVFMPAGENKFYCDVEATNDNFGAYIGEDLVDFTRTMFRLSDKREDTFIGGLSMGGEGAILTALRYPETFSHVGAFSSALVLEHYPAKDEQVIGLKGKRSLMDTVIGPEASYAGSQNDYHALAKRVAVSGTSQPKFYMACGLQDGLLSVNRSFKDFLAEEGYQVEYHEEDGNHEWDFWDRQLKSFLEWLPLEKKIVNEER